MQLTMALQVDEWKRLRFKIAQKQNLVGKLRRQSPGVGS